MRQKPPKTLLQMLKAQLTDPMVLILVGAAAFSTLLREWTEASVIFAIVIVNAIIGIAQEKKAQASLDALRKMSAPSARVLRQGEESIVPAMLNGSDHFAYIQGYADGTVRPNASITRAQVATIFFRLLEDVYKRQRIYFGQQHPLYRMRRAG